MREKDEKSPRGKSVGGVDANSVKRAYESFSKKEANSSGKGASKLISLPVTGWVKLRR